MGYPPEEKRAYQRAWRVQRIAAAKAYLGGECVVCATKDGLEFHHKNPAEKEFNISQVYSYRWVVVCAELDKCELRCKQHHRDAHARKLEHGHTHYKQGCRCDICCTARREYNRAWMRRWRRAGLDKSRPAPKRRNKITGH